MTSPRATDPARERLNFIAGYDNIHSNLVEAVRAVLDLCDDVEFQASSILDIQLSSARLDSGDVRDVIAEALGVAR